MNLIGTTLNYCYNQSRTQIKTKHTINIPKQMKPTPLFSDI